MDYTHFFCHNSKAFYPFELKEMYERAGSWPILGLAVSCDDYREFNALPPEGKELIVDANGAPAWGDIAWSEFELRAKKSAVVQEHLDHTARTCGFASIADAISYAEEPVVPEFMELARGLRAWRSLVWRECQSILASALAGNRVVPLDSALIAELPEFRLPDGGVSPVAG